MFSLIPTDANDPQWLMRRKAPNKQTNDWAFAGVLSIYADLEPRIPQCIQYHWMFT